MEKTQGKVDASKMSKFLTDKDNQKALQQRFINQKKDIRDAEKDFVAKSTSRIASRNT